MADDYVDVRVPARWLPEIYKRLAELASEDASRPSARYGDTGTKWEVEADLLTRMYWDSQRPHRQLIAFLAEHPDKWFYTSELAKQLELEHGSKGLAGMLGAFARRANNRYGGQTPWESVWDASSKEARHRMPSDRADVLQSVIGAAAEPEYS